MKEQAIAANEQELRRHFTGIAQAALDALHVWLACEQFKTLEQAMFQTDKQAAAWYAIPEHLTTVIDQLIDITQSEGEPLQLQWVQWRRGLATQIGALNAQLDTLLYPF